MDQAGNDKRPPAGFNDPEPVDESEPGGELPGREVRQNNDPRKPRPVLPDEPAGPGDRRREGTESPAN
jgi:hypothetical protein